MKIQFYSTPDGVKTWKQCYLGGTMLISSLEYDIKYIGYGAFSLVLPYSARWLEVLKLNYLVEVCRNGSSGSSADWFIIQSIGFDAKTIEITGYDLNYLLTLRISTYINGATQDYDPVSGATWECIKHYLDSNMIEASGSRKMPMVFDENGVVGLTSDSYLAKLQPLSDIVNELCESAGIGYRITAGYSGNVAQLKFRLIEGTDRSITQRVNSPVILGASKRNVKALSFNYDCSNEINAVWATGAGATVAVYRDSSNIPSGLLRRESAVEVDVPTVSDLSRYALYEIRDNVQTDEYAIEPDSRGYGVLYNIGDIVSVKDDALRNFYHGRIVGAQMNFMPSGTAVKITVAKDGKARKKPIDRIINNLRAGTLKSNG